MNIDKPRAVFLFCTLLTALTALLIMLYIFWVAFPTFQRQGLNFFLGTVWNYDTGEYGIFNFIAGTLALTAVTMVMAVPLSILTALFLAEWAPKRLDGLLSSIIELLVGIPSVVFGIFGYFVLRHYFIDYINPFISNTLGFIPLFHNPTPQFGDNILLASTVLTLMILPTITALTRDAIHAVPNELREASLALGATKWETIKKVVLPESFPGILTGCILGMMRAMGETMAIVMLMGNYMKIPTSIFDGGTAMTSKILLDISYWIIFDEPKSALFAIAATLFALEILLVAMVRYISHRYSTMGGYSQ
ncbi:MAG: phosphate ABC transporter permease subunit PstC [Methanoregula sp.]|nr:phosphate ABC transporter permease subunit PstC [Methanoregula sp.]